MNMGFIENLAKGFVRSAVNQVGRDTGRVVSNKIYGNAHATPVRGISQSNGVFINDETNEPISEAEFLNRLKNEGYHIYHFITNPFWKWICWCFGLFVTYFIIECDGGFWSLLPSILLVLIAILKIFQMRESMMIYQNKEMAMYKADRRYSTGKRYIGHSMQKVEYYIKPTEEYKKDGIIISIVYFILAIFMVIFPLFYGNKFVLYICNPISSFIIILSLHIVMRFKYRNKTY